MNRLLLLLACCFSAFGLSAQTGDVQVNEYVYSDRTHFTIIDAKTSRFTRTYKVKILNEYANTYTRCILPYSSFQKISSFQAVITDENGRQLRKLGLKEGRDILYDHASISSDSRVKVWQIVQARYPFIVEVSYQIDLKGSLFYPGWHPVSAPNQEIGQAVFIVSDPQNRGFRYQSLNTGEPVREPEGKGFRYTWESGSIPAFRDEPFARNSMFCPIVYTAPTDFEIEGYRGNMVSWESLGTWLNLLNRGKNDLKPEVAAEIRALCAPLESDREKVRAVYRYVQQNTRYANIALGIGGWQPFSAQFVHQKKYGDCKGLTFYTHALLEAVGISSLYTLIRAGAEAEPLSVDFPSAHFNHAILTVPLGPDTLWLECTSQTNPMGYLGRFTSDRHALMVTPEGGVLIRTRSYSEQENLTITRCLLELSPQGHARLQLNREMSGIQVENEGFLSILDQTEHEKKKWIQDQAGYGNLFLETYRFSPLQGDEVPRGGYELSGTLKDFCSVSNRRLFVTPFAFSALKIRLAGDTRRFPIEIRYPSSRCDTIRIRIPEGYTPENHLPEVELEEKYGHYSTRMIEREGELWFIRRFVMKAGSYPASEYEAFKAFITTVQHRDNQRLALIRQ